VDNFFNKKEKIYMLGLLTGILGGKGGGILETGLKVIDELYDSPEEKREAELTLEKIEAKLKEKQINVNIAEAKHKNIFVSGWRPAIGWVGAFALMFEFILSPAIEWYSKFSGLNLTAPEIQTGPLLAIVTSMLGVASLRSFEKSKGLTK
jgi:hypothetical protein